ncbi:MAG: AraC family transcriptional regulator [Mucilaginibacter sp.]
MRAKLYIDENYAEDIDLDNIADEAFFSKFHFIRLFKKTYVKTPHQYLTFVRVERSKLLLQENMPVAEVCYAVGFDSVSSFTGLFKRITGITPSVYQQDWRRKLEEIKTVPLKHIPNCFAEMKGWTQNSNFKEAEI